MNKLKKSLKKEPELINTDNNYNYIFELPQLKRNVKVEFLGYNPEKNVNVYVYEVFKHITQLEAIKAAFRKKDSDFLFDNDRFIVNNKFDSIKNRIEISPDDTIENLNSIINNRENEREKIYKHQIKMTEDIKRKEYWYNFFQEIEQEIKQLNKQIRQLKKEGDSPEIQFQIKGLEAKRHKLYNKKEEAKIK